MGTIRERIKGFIENKKTEKTIKTAGSFLSPNPIDAAVAAYKVYNDIIKDKRWEEACARFDEGQLKQAKDLFEAIGQDFGWDDKIRSKIMEIHEKMQGTEGIIAARNLAIFLIGSQDNSIRENALDCYKRNTTKLQEIGFTDTISPARRKYIFIGETCESIGGTYLMNDSERAINWIFDLDNLPKDLVFPSGHPQQGLYIAHPVLPDFYYPRKDVEYALFKEKMLEFIKLIRCLGATRIVFQSSRGLSVSQNKSFTTDIETEVGVKMVGVRVDPKGTWTKDTKSDYSQQEAREILLSPKNRIYIPDNLVWYKTDSEWEEIVQGRMDRSTDHYDITVSMEESNFISKELDAKVKSSVKIISSYLIGITGNYAFDYEDCFTQNKNAAWEIHIDFAPLDEKLIPIGEGKKPWYKRIFG